MKNILRKYLFILIALLPIMACTEDPEETTGTISGYVTEAPNGTEPISGVTVSILSTGQSTTTGSTGSFSFINMQPGNYSLQFSKTGYTTNSRSINVVAGNSQQCDIQLSKAIEEAEIEINPSSLNFGTTQTEMSITIKNKGKATAEWALNLGNNDWLSASQLGGSIQGGRTQSVTFAVDRNYLSEMKTVVVNIQAFGNSYPIHISCAPRSTTSNMTVEPTELNFGSTLTELTFTIRNTGKEALTWNISEANSTALNLSAKQGTISGGGNAVIVVKLDRSKITDTLKTTLIVSDGIKDIPINVTANISGSSGEEPIAPSSIVVPSGLYAYFTFNGNIDNFSENKVEGYCSPDPVYSAGITEGSQSLSFIKKEESSFIVSEGLIDSRSMTVSFWAKNISEGNIFYVTSSNKNNGGEVMMRMAYDDGHLKYVISRYNNHYNYSETGNFTHKTIDDGKWHNIVLVSDYNKLNYGNATTSLYIDGKMMDTVTESINPFSEGESSNKHYGTGTKFVLGGAGVPNMQIANLRVYDARQLGESDIKKIYEAKQ